MIHTEPGRLAFPITKIEAPAPRASLAPRPTLMLSLQQALRTRRLVLLCAPAGFGKTAALAQALAGLEAQTARTWIHAETVDDLGRFAACVVAALEPCDLPWLSSPDGLVAALDGSPGATRALAAALVNALHGSDAPRGLIVIDDVERLDDPAVFEFLDLLLQGLPPHWGLALASRVDPPLALGRWHVLGELAEFRQAELRFDAAELRALLMSAGLAAGDDEVAALQTLTHGWPAALGLLAGRGRALPSALSTQFALDAAGRRHLFDYLASEVLQSLPPVLADFLLRCAVLAEWTPERCAAVAGDANAAAWLGLIEQRDLFIGRLGGDADALVPDPLFREFLEDQLQRRRPGEMPELLARAAATEPDAARRVDFLLRAGRHGAAAQALREAAPELLGRGGALQVQRLLERFPAPARDALPSWHFVHGQLAWLRWDWPTLSLAMKRAERGFAEAGVEPLRLAAAALQPLGLAGCGQLHAADAAIRALANAPLAAADRAVLETARAWVAAALGPRGAAAAAITAVVDALLEADAPPALWYQCLPNFRFTTMPGLQGPIERFVREALRVAGDEFVPLRMGARTLTAWRLLWRGDPAAAQLLLDEVAADARWFGMPRALRWAVDCAQAALHALAGRAAEMNAACAPMLDDFPPGNPWRRSALGFWLRMSWLLEDRAQWEALYPLMRAGAGAAEWPHIEASATLADGQQALLRGQPEAAERLLAGAAAALAEVDNVGLLDAAQALQALAQLRQGRAAEAVATLTPCLQRIAEGGDPLGLPLVGATAIDALAGVWPAAADPALGLALQRARDRARSWRRPAADAPRSVVAPAAPVPHGPLSVRERAVLERIAAGETNKVIARALALSPHTVKRHVANILNKLGLATRAQAAAWLGARGA